MIRIKILFSEHENERDDLFIQIIFCWPFYESSLKKFSYLPFVIQCFKCTVGEQNIIIHNITQILVTYITTFSKKVGLECATNQTFNVITYMQRCSLPSSSFLVYTLLLFLLISFGYPDSMEICYIELFLRKKLLNCTGQGYVFTNYLETVNSIIILYY